MKNSVKKALSLALCLSFLLSLASCKQQPSVPAQTTEPITESTAVPSTLPSTDETTVVSTQATTVTTTEATTVTTEATTVTTEATTVTTTQVTTPAPTVPDTPSTISPAQLPDKNYTPSGNQLRFEHNGITYYNVSVASGGFSGGYNDDEYFPEGEQGYYISGGTYNLSAEVFNRVITVPCFGGGAIKYKDWRRINYTSTDTLLFDGILPANRMDDPLYVAMCAPSEGQDYLSTYHNQTNGDTNVNTKAEHVSVIPIAAVYLATDCTLPDDTTVTLCIGKINCAVKYKGEDWKLIFDSLPSEVNLLYPLPWQLHYDSTSPVREKRISMQRVRDYGDHYEVTFKIGDFRSDGTDERLIGRTLHFWGNNGAYKFSNDGKKGSDVEGIATAYSIWVKEPECAGALTCDTGADLRDANGNVGQSFSTKTYEITTEKRYVVGHNVVPQNYDKVMDSERVQELLGMK